MNYTFGFSFYIIRKIQMMDYGHITISCGGRLLCWVRHLFKTGLYWTSYSVGVIRKKDAELFCDEGYNKGIWSSRHARIIGRSSREEWENDLIRDRIELLGCVVWDNSWGGISSVSCSLVWMVMCVFPQDYLAIEM